jgi:BON domain
MDQRDDTRGNEHVERGREANGGRNYHPGSQQRTHWSEPQPLYGRQQPFGPPEETHYYGTGSAGYGGPGFTGGAYAYGNGPRDEGRQIEDEYSDESAVSYEQGPGQQYGQRQYGQRQYAQPQYGQPRYGEPQGQQYGPRYGQQSRQQPYGNDRYSGYPDTRARRFTTGPKGYQRSDERLKEDICERLMMSHYIDSSDVSVEVRGARVALEGTVPSRHMKHAIEDIVDACPGVQDIDNRVRIANPLTRQEQSGQSQSLTGGGAGVSSATGSGSTPGGVNTPNGTKSR